MPKLMLADIEDGMPVRTLAYLKQKRLVPYKNKPGAFLALTLTDRSGSIEAKIFDEAEAVAATLTERQVVSIIGRASTYQGTLGLVLDDVGPHDGEVDRADFMPAYPGDVAALEAKLDALIASITDYDLGRLVRDIFSDREIRELFCIAPAAKGMHGAYLHGLLEHVVRQADLAETICHSYPGINRDLVIAGVLLHDIGKIREFSWDMDIEYTTLGRLQEHLVIGDRLVYEHGRQLGISEETALQISHLILSHHGTREFGAVSVPKTVEAVILHSVDHTEAKVTHCLEMLRKTPADAQWSEFDRIEGRMWYNGNSAERVHG